MASLALINLLVKIKLRSAKFSTLQRLARCDGRVPEKTLNRAT